MSSCAHHACVHPARLHGVCRDHLVTTLAAGRRATQNTPQQRMAVLLRARYGTNPATIEEAKL